MSFLECRIDDGSYSSRRLKSSMQLPQLKSFMEIFSIIGFFAEVKNLNVKFKVKIFKGIYSTCSDGNVVHQE